MLLLAVLSAMLSLSLYTELRDLRPKPKNYLIPFLCSSALAAILGIWQSLRSPVQSELGSVVGALGLTGALLAGSQLMMNGWDKIERLNKRRGLKSVK